MLFELSELVASKTEAIAIDVESVINKVVIKRYFFIFTYTPM